MTAAIFVKYFMGIGFLLFVAYAVVGIGSLLCLVFDVNPTREIQKLTEEYREFKGSDWEWVKSIKKGGE